jgi:thiol:disulfide interchange protein DsbD
MPTMTITKTGPAALLAALFLGICLHGASAQTADDPARAETVSWTIEAPADAVRPGGRLALTVKGAVLDGWHVYGLKQLAAGPTPLRVKLEANDVAAEAGTIKASAATKVHDRAFDLTVEYYSKDFTLTVPARVAAKAAGGPQQIPVSVRFQTCNDRICQPPKTLRLSVPVTVRTEG